MPEQNPEQQILHSLDLLRRDMARVETRLGELVSLERYTTEHAVQERDHTRLETRVAELEKARSTMMNMILSSLIFPLVIAVAVYMLAGQGG